MEPVEVVLPEALSSFVRERVKSGGYDDAGQYVRELIRADQQKTAERLLEAAIVKGLASGPAEPVTTATWASLRAALPEMQ